MRLRPPASFRLKRKQVTVVVAALLSLAIFAVGSWWPQEPALVVTALDVGQGDALLVELPNGQRWLVDGGPDLAVNQVLDRYLPFGSRRLDGLILTHPHADHLTGLIGALRAYEVRQIVMPNVTHTTPEYETWLKEIRDRHITTLAADHPFVWQGDIAGRHWSWEFWYPSNPLPSTLNDLNEASIVSKVTYGDRSVLLMGDATSRIEQLLIEQGRSLKSDVLKVGHHGSDTSTDPSFLQAVQPSAAIISAGRGNAFGHPAPLILERLTQAGVVIWRTDQQGAVQVWTNGHDLQVGKTYRNLVQLLLPD